MKKKNEKSNVKQEVKLKAGDVVQLKSGGPRMAVDRIEKDYVIVVWFASDYLACHSVAVNMACLNVIK